MLGGGYHLTGDSTVDSVGTVYFTDAARNRILKIDLAGAIRTYRENTNGAHGVAFGADGRFYVGQHDRKRIVAFSSDGRESVITEGVQTHHLIVTSRNHIYFSVPPTHEVWLADTAGQKRVVHKGLNWPRGVRASPDESVLVVNDPPTRWVWSYRERPEAARHDRARDRRQRHGRATYSCHWDLAADLDPGLARREHGARPGAEARAGAPAIEGSVAKRAATPDEVGTVGALLMGPDGGFIAGSDFLMDGGVTASYWYGEVAEVRGQS